MLNHTDIAVWLWQFRMGLNNDDFLPFETRLHFGIKARNPVSSILSPVNATTILLTSLHAIFCSKWGPIKKDNKLLHDLHFTNTFHDQIVYTFAFKMLLTRSSDMSNLDVIT